MKSLSVHALTAILVVLGLIATACSGANSATVDLAGSPAVAAAEPTAIPPAGPTTNATARPTPEPAPEPTQEPEGSIEDVAAATVKIIAQGTFVPPFELQENNVAGIGTGFIIDEAGVLVTNNHVVTGATFIEVFLDGATEPTPARLLGVSECSDLAVLQLEGDGYDFLEFRGMDGVVPGLPVFAAGYPLNLDRDFADVDYTLTAGIVSTTQASGQTTWASVQAVIEHDARIRGGNSGGPLVDEQGRVVGINFAGEDTNDLNEAIAAAEARPIIEALRNGDVEALGINGRAVTDGRVPGVWVQAVAPGTPADRAGVIAGDLILTMNGQELAADGTMSAYCDIVRSSGPTTPIDIEVLRLASQEVLGGQINGTPLVRTVSLTEDNSLAERMTASTSEYTSYDLITDDTNTVRVAVPSEWAERDGMTNPNFGPSVFASTDLSAFADTWTVPGIILERSDELTSDDIDAVLDNWNLPCEERGGRDDYEDGVFTGRFEVWTSCGGTTAVALTLAVSPADGNSVVRLFMRLITDADIAAADRALATFGAAP